MRIVANESHIKTRRKIGERAPLVGLVVLAVSTVLIFVRPDLIWLTMIIVWVGFLISLTGSYLGDRYVGPNAHHQRVPEALKGMGGRYTLLVYRLSTPFVLVEPGGLTTITVKSQSGTVSYEDGRWRHKQKLGLLRRFAGQEALGRPFKMAEAERAHVSEYLENHLPEGMEVQVRGLVLFIHPDVVLHVDEETAPFPALRAAELKRWLRKNPLEPRLSTEIRSALFEALDLEDPRADG